MAHVGPAASSAAAGPTERMRLLTDLLLGSPPTLRRHLRSPDTTSTSSSAHLPKGRRQRPPAGEAPPEGDPPVRSRPTDLFSNQVCIDARPKGCSAISRKFAMRALCRGRQPSLLRPQ